METDALITLGMASSSALEKDVDSTESDSILGDPNPHTLSRRRSAVNMASGKTYAIVDGNSHEVDPDIILGETTR